MGDVVAVLKLMPEDTAIDLGDVRARVLDLLPDDVNLEGSQQEDVAFGLTALLITVTIDDAEGGAEPLRERLEKIDGVESVQVTDVGRV